MKYSQSIELMELSERGEETLRSHTVTWVIYVFHIKKKKKGGRFLQRFAKVLFGGTPVTSMSLPSLILPTFDEILIF